MRFFNVAGPCIRGEHYMIDPATRLPGVERLVDMSQYFVLHAARQSGKTTCMQDLAKRLNESGRYYALYCSLEGLQGIVDPEKGIPTIVGIIRNTLAEAGTIPHVAEFAEDTNYSNYADVLRMALTQYCKLLDKPLVLLFDEADCLSEATLISFLRQLRNGYNSRGVVPFVRSIALTGMRNLRDFKARVRPESETLGSASPFNIVTEALTLKNFTEDEIRALYQQHTDETGQLFEDDAIALVYEQTQGQPWLVNAIAYDVVARQFDWNYTQPVTADRVATAIQTLILRRDTHIDNLLERLKEERVRRVIEPMITGEQVDTFSNDFYYTRDLGLIRVTPGKPVAPANPIYAEVIVRTLNEPMQDALQNSYPAYQIPRYLKDGRIDMDYLMRDFQQFWRENSSIWVDKFEYREAAPHLILMAFLQRVVNGGGQVVREMALGTGRLDICLVYENHK
ncbi:MAG: AAA-like domain-containing protein, partial [Prevotellaceae bacterium]|nr:AAA-like domain-containing protein [Prevotellaceae bacterium]